MPTTVPFERLGHLIRVEVGFDDGSTGRFLVDTGIGITVVGSGFAKQHGFTETGRSFVGKRMAGDTVTAPLVRMPGARLGDQVLDQGEVAVADFGPPDTDSGFDGILGLDLLGTLPLTVDPRREVVVLGARPAAGLQVPVTLQREGEAVTLFVDVRLPDGRVVRAELDTGSASTIVATRHVGSCRVELDGPDSRLVQDTNETGVAVQRWFVPVPGAIALAAAPQTEQRDAQVMFQDLVLDALLGTDFLDRYVQTYDTGSATLTLVPLEQAGPKAP